SLRRRGLVLSLRGRDPAQRLESGAETGRIRRAQLWKQRLVGLLRFGKRAPLLQCPRVVERRRLGLRGARQHGNQADIDHAERHEGESSRRRADASSAQGDASAGRTGLTEPSASFPLIPSIWTGTLAVTPRTLPAPGSTPGKSSETSRETLVSDG